MIFSFWPLIFGRLLLGFYLNHLLRCDLCLFLRHLRLKLQVLSAASISLHAVSELWWLTYSALQCRTRMSKEARIRIPKFTQRSRGAASLFCLLVSQLSNHCYCLLCFETTPRSTTSKRELRGSKKSREFDL